MNVATYMAKVYPEPPCWLLIADIYTTELGETVDEYKTITNTIRRMAREQWPRAIAEAFRLELHKGVHGFCAIEEPVDYAVVLMGRTEKRGLHHAGIYYGGKVLHALDAITLHQELDTLRAEYQVIQFWAK